MDFDPMNKKHILSFLLLLLLLPAGCTKEDNRNCPAGLYVCFEPNNPKHNYQELVTQVDLYFYGADGELKADFHYSRNDLRTHDRAAFVPRMPAGEYKLVAVVNSGKDYETYGIENYETLYTKVKQDIVSDKLTDFFTSEKQITVGRPASLVQTETLKLAKHNNNIRLKILYDNYTAPPNTVLDAFVEESCGHIYYSTYSGPPTRDVRYLPWNELSGSDGLPLQFDISTFRLWIGSDAALCLREADAVSGIDAGRFYTLNITDALVTVKNAAGEFLYDTDEKLEYNDEYEITITIGKDFVILSVTIDNWDIISGGVVV